MKPGFLLFLLAPLAMSAGHRVLQIMPLPAQGGQALLVDSAARRLYVAGSNHLLVLNLDTGGQLANIADLPSIAAIAVAPGIDRGYVTSSADNRVAIFALSDFGHLGQIPLGSDPGALVYDTAAHRFYAMNRGSRNASAIDADDGEVEQTIDFGGRPVGAVGNDHGTVFAVLEDRNEVVQIDAKKMALSDRWKIPDCKTPHGIALDDHRERLFIGCSERRLVVLNAKDGTLIGTARTGEGGGDIATDSSAGLVYVANRDGSISVLAEASAGKYEVVETVPTEPGATSIAFDPATRRLFTLAPTHAPASRTVPQKPGESTAPGPSQILIIGR
jgi:DNA-binding beta-propeller fold protein YncE